MTDINEPLEGKGLYQLKYRKPMPIKDILTWGKSIGNTRSKVRRTYVGGKMISTRFLGINYNMFTEGKPILFETMVFSDTDSVQRQYLAVTRCSTWREALKMHRDAVAKVKDK